MLLGEKNKEQFLFGLIDHLSRFPNNKLEKKMVQELRLAKNALKVTNQAVRTNYKNNQQIQNRVEVKRAGSFLSFWKDNKLSRFLNSHKSVASIKY